MLPKRERLDGKTVNFLLRRRQVIHARHYSFFYTKQYPNMSIWQRGFFVPKVIHKSAVKRNMMRRSFYMKVKEYTPFLSQKYRIFVRPNKKAQEEWQSLVAKSDQKHIIATLGKWFDEDIRHFQKKVIIMKK